MFSHENWKSVLTLRCKKDWQTRCQKFHRDLLGRSRENRSFIPFSHAFCILSRLMFQPNTNQSSICWRNLLAPGTMHEKSSHETSLTWTAVSTITESRSHQQALGNLTNEWTPVGLSPINLLSSFFTFQQKSWIHGLVCVPSVNEWRI